MNIRSLFQSRSRHKAIEMIRKRQRIVEQRVRLSYRGGYVDGILKVQTYISIDSIPLILVDKKPSSVSDPLTVTPAQAQEVLTLLRKRYYTRHRHELLIQR